MSRSGPGIPVAFWRRQLRHDLSGSLSLVITTLVASFFVSVAPRVLEHAAAADVRHAVAEAVPEQRNLTFELQSRIGAASSDAPFRLVEDRGALLIEDDVPESVASVVDDRLWVYDSPTFEVSSYPDQVVGPFPTTFRFRYQEGIEDELSVIRGRLPGSPLSVLGLRGLDCPGVGAPSVFVAYPFQECAVVQIPVFETAISEQTAADMALDVGDQVMLSPSVADTKWLRAREGVLERRFVLRVSGIVALSDPTGEFWYADSSLHRPRITENPDFRFVTAVGLIRPDRYGQLVAELPVVPHDYTWRYVVDPDRVAEADLGQLRRDLDKLAPDGVETTTRLQEVLADHAAQRRLSERLLSIGTGGVIVTAVAALLAIAIMRAVRLRSVSSLIIDRGASRPQLLRDGFRTGIVLSFPAAAVGGLLAWSVLPRTASGVPLVLAVAVAAGASLGVASTVVAPDQASRSRGRRLVAELVVIVVAAGSTVITRRRGEIASADAGLDVLVALTPALLACAAGLVAVRVGGPMMRLGAVLSRRRPGVGAFVGFRRQIVQPLAARFPIVVLTIAVSTAIFSSVLVSSITAGQIGASWSAVGADYRIETVTRGIPLPPSFGSVVAEQAYPSAEAAVIRDVRVTGTDRSTVVDVVAVDTARYLDVLADAPVGRESLRLLEEANSTSGEQIPVLVVGHWPSRQPFAESDSIDASVGPFAAELVVAGVVDQFPSVDPGRQTIVVDRATLTSATDARTVQASAVFVAGDEELGEELVGLVDDRVARTVSRDEHLVAIAGDPLSTWTRTALWGIVGWSIAMSVVAAVSAVMMSARVRGRDLAVLRVLGMKSRDGAVIAAIEQVPMVVIAMLTGIGVGLTAPILVEPALDFASFAGSAARVGVKIDVGTIVVITGALSLVVLLGVAASVRALDRSEAARMLRVGDER